MEPLKEYGVPYDFLLFCAHRTPEQARAFALSARDNGFGVILCAAGKAAHLAGAFAANTTLPVIGIPIKSSTLDGLDALLSTVQMPSGVPVATVAIGGTIITGGVGDVLGSVLGSLVRSILDPLTSDFGVPAEWTTIVIGLMILVFVVLQRAVMAVGGDKK